VYSIDILPPKVQMLLQFNPMTPLITALHKIAVYRQLPAWESLLFPLIVALLLSWWAVGLFKRHQHDLMDEL
jgi:lipopolysaccharide transport system permease protein